MNDVLSHLLIMNDLKWLRIEVPIWDLVAKGKAKNQES